MRLAAVLAAAVVVVVVVSAAPPSPMRPPSSASAPMLRPKRGNTPPKSATIPYSNYRRVSGVHRPYSAWKQLASVRRYRYPLYRKRSYPAHYDYEDEVFLPEEEVEEDYPSYAPRPSLFRERNMKEEEEEEMAALEEAAKEEAERRENELLLNQGYFHDLPDEDVAGYDYSAPYVLSYPELERLNQLYDMEKEAMDASDQDFPVYAPGRKTMAPTATGRFLRRPQLRQEASHGDEARGAPGCGRRHAPESQEAPAVPYVRGRQVLARAGRAAAAGGAAEGHLSLLAAVRDPDMMIRKRKKRNTTTATTNRHHHHHHSSSSQEEENQHALHHHHHQAQDPRTHHHHHHHHGPHHHGGAQRPPQQEGLQRLLQVGEARRGGAGGGGRGGRRRGGRG
ncbi:lateral signaling target protein 2 homolog [Scylla paramamosain]|uniref:lateral signaling target protein 2 homolog n=1 Tax=Scylla paramamosain TaxID=85552 RepID=UPI0030835BE3